MAYCEECGERIESKDQRCWETGGACYAERAEPSVSRQTHGNHTSRCAEYKGRKYRVLYLGATKYGKRAHLQFFDGTKDFWCDGNAVVETRA